MRQPLCSQSRDQTAGRLRRLKRCAGTRDNPSCGDQHYCRYGGRQGAGGLGAGGWAAVPLLCGWQAWGSVTPAAWQAVIPHSACCCPPTSPAGGVQALYAGLTPALARAFPANAAQWLAWELCLQQLQRCDGGSGSGGS